MPKIDIAAMRQRIQSLNTNATQAHQNYTQQSNNNTQTQNKTQSSDEVNLSARDSELRTRLDSAKETANAYANAQDGLDDIKGRLNDLKSMAQKAQNGELEEGANPDEALEKIGETVEGNTLNGREILGDFDLESLGLEGVDINSEDAVEKIEGALAKVENEDEISQQAEEANDKVDALNDRKEMYAEADELVQQLASQMTASPGSFMSAQSLVNADVVNQLLNF